MFKGFYYFQEEAIQSIPAYFTHSAGNPLVQMPTGTGKSLVIGGFIHWAFANYPRQRFLALTHVKELIEQNAEKLHMLWPAAPLGILSAGLRQRDTAMPIIFGGVATAVKCIEAVGYRDLLLIDEAHLLSPDSNTMYQRIIAGLRAINPFLKIVGFTATGYRLGQGKIVDDGLFNDVCYDLTHVEAFNRLIAEGYISPPIAKKTDVEIDVSGVRLNSGEFAQGELEDRTSKIMRRALEEVCFHGQTRHSWMIFAPGVANAENAASILQQFGVAASCVHSKLSSAENTRRIKAFKSGELRAIVNANKLTTGFDHPPIDLIGMLRPTLSTALWVQMLGRGTRPSVETNKENCLVLDFAGNTRRLGPINDPVIPRKKGEGTGEAPIRICEKCGVYNHASARKCIGCGEEFDFSPKILPHAGTEPLLRSDAPIVEYFDVDRVLYRKHEKENGTPTLKVSYVCGLRMFHEWVAFEHKGFASKKARDWWYQRFDPQTMPEEPPPLIDYALGVVQRLRTPKKVRVWINKKYPEVLGYDF